VKKWGVENVKQREVKGKSSINTFPWGGEDPPSISGAKNTLENVQGGVSKGKPA